MSTTIMPKPKTCGVYIHIPFCKQACHYCNFHFSVNLKTKARVLASIVREIELRKDYAGTPTISTIYFGGGTPSMLAVEEIETILLSIKKQLPCQDTPEITLEMNPDDATLEKLQGLRNIGINRLSIGIQSFDDNVLKYLNRSHDSKAARHSLDLARQAGFENISIDLIYAIPARSATLWQKDLDTAMNFLPEHLSSYCLTIEDKTVFGHQLQNGKLRETPEPEAVEQYYMLTNTLDRYGYAQYEVSNFARPGFRSIHNSHYWNHTSAYLGLGPGAHSYDGHSRQWNISNNYTYTQTLEEGKIPCTIEMLTPENKMNEYIMTTLRTSEGCSHSWLLEHYGYDLLQRSSSEIDLLVKNKLCTVNTTKITLTTAGMLLADKIAQDLAAHCHPRNSGNPTV